MGIFGKLASAAINVATLPIAIAKDVVTMAGAMTDQDEPYTLQKMKEAGRDLHDAQDEMRGK